VAVIRREIRRGNKQKEDVGGRSRAQDGAGAACIVAFPPPPSTHVLPIRSGEGGTADSTPPPPPISNYCDGLQMEVKSRKTDIGQL
jgi:hypothetical protein